jgi:hypothetical protein
MFKWLLHRVIRNFERQWNYDASYIHEMINADPRAVWMFQRAALANIVATCRLRHSPPRRLPRFAMKIAARARSWAWR